MNVVFVNPTDNIWGQGVNILASILRKNKHKVKIVYIPSIKNNIVKFDPEDWLREFQDTGAYLVSFMSNSLPCAIEFTNFVKRIQPGTPIVWGGIHPTVMPEDSLSYVDHVGMGECEEALPEFLDRLEKGLDVSCIRNFWIRNREGKICKNPLRPPIVNLDDLPPNEYTCDDRYLIHMGKLLALTPELLSHYFADYPIGKTTLYTMTSRGCPFYCSYCINAKLNNLYGSNKLRRRDLEKVIDEEVKPAVEKFPFFRDMALIVDDDFFIHGPQELKNFGRIWKRELSIPFSCLATPASITDEKTAILVDAGLKILEIGIQTASERINREVYNRHCSNNMIIDKMKLLDRYVKKNGLSVICDFIIDNPYETDIDIKKSIDLYLRFPFKSEINFFSLTPYPGTPIRDRLKMDGFIGNNYEEFTREFSLSVNRGHRYLTLLFLMKGKFARWIPDTIVRLLMWGPFVFIGNLTNVLILTPFFRTSLFKRAGKNMAAKGALLYGHLFKDIAKGGRSSG